MPSCGSIFVEPNDSGGANWQLANGKWQMASRARRIISALSSSALSENITPEKLAG